jgi:hypothetical protein
MVATPGQHQVTQEIEVRMRAVEVEAMPARTKVMRVSRRQKVPVAAKAT